eukprot:2030162-Karenia_brevis.AAC.1
MFFQVSVEPQLPVTDFLTTVYNIVGMWNYGRNKATDMLELCGGDGRISQACFRRGLISGGSLYLVTGCNIGHKMTQKAINLYLNTCYVMVTIRQPNWRTLGNCSHYNWHHNYDTTKKHHDEDLPHLPYCGEVALIQLQKGMTFDA